MFTSTLVTLFHDFRSFTQAVHENEDATLQCSEDFEVIEEKVISVLPVLSVGQCGRIGTMPC